ncbi:MAG: hypothetical protein AVDCRST_MAG13-2089, partial [uncultured Solirubrobacteraceae bacterium]
GAGACRRCSAAARRGPRALPPQHGEAPGVPARERGL